MMNIESLKEITSLHRYRLHKGINWKLIGEDFGENPYALRRAYYRQRGEKVKVPEDILKAFNKPEEEADDYLSAHRRCTRTEKRLEEL